MGIRAYGLDARLSARLERIDHMATMKAVIVEDDTNYRHRVLHGEMHFPGLVRALEKARPEDREDFCKEVIALLA
jgi:hypothetical protein